ncbi:MAG: hypothetical protein KatS3mg124_0224 [Porticoccaceae bacterium]|nr:MAG: hypothetical protein KatS3mg124_0224 [Porticoccaceae bacterium]
MKDLLELAPPVERPFFEGCRQGVLRLQRCRRCGRLQGYPRTSCAGCWSDDLQWVDASGEGCVVSYTVVRLPLDPALPPPYVVALVRLEEGPILLGHVLDCPPEAVSVGMAVRAGFADRGAWKSLVVFYPSQPIAR